VPMSVRAHRSYTRFLVFCTARSGSTMLSSAFNEHPELIFHGEAFPLPEWPINFVGVDHDSKEHVFVRSVLQKLCNDDPIEFLKTLIWPADFNTGFGIGLKLKVEEAANYRKDVMDWILADDEIKIILIHREDSWLRFLSILKSAETGRFNSFIDSPNADDFSTTQRPISLGQDQIIALLRSALANERAYVELSERIKRRHAYVELTYENVNSNWNSCISKVEEFLSVAPFAIRPRTAKLSPFNYILQPEVLELIDEEIAGTGLHKYFHRWRDAPAA
jgi:LPS sulfotransferase NodH